MYMIFSKDYLKKYRQINYPINDFFWCRWSPRAMSGEPLKEVEVLSLLEAARYAPSSFNEQPWRFIYTLKDSLAWQAVYNNLVPFNQEWAKNSGALVIVLSFSHYRKNNKKNDKASFDTGAAWQNIALQASLMSLVAHGMSGVNFEKLRSDFEISDNYKIEMVIALGHLADKNVLSNELAAIEEPSVRLKLEDIASLDKFNF